MRNGEGERAQLHVQLVTDTRMVWYERGSHHDASTTAIWILRWERCQQKFGRQPQQVIADGDYTNHASVQAAARAGRGFFTVPGKTV